MSFNNECTGHDTMDREVILLFGGEEVSVAYVSEFLLEQEPNNYLRDRLFRKVQEAIEEIDIDGSMTDEEIIIKLR